MNFFKDLAVVVAFMLFLIDFGEENRTAVSGPGDSQSAPRNKRAFSGNEAPSGKYTFIVFLRTALRPYSRAKDKCSERACTGTLVHPRFVLTTNFCVPVNVKPNMVSTQYCGKGNGESGNPPRVRRGERFYVTKRVKISEIVLY